MTCYHPLKGWIVGTHEKTGKRKFKFTSYDVGYLTRSKLYGDLVPVKKNACDDFYECSERVCTYECLKMHGFDGARSNVIVDYVPIPCGKCIGCQLDHAREWSARMMMENEYSTKSQFITLTYDDEHLTSDFISWNWYDDDGKCVHRCLQYPNISEQGNMTLNKGDYVAFNKRLRKRFGNGIRFYLAGEYGEANKRAHYHGIYFNLDIPDRKVKFVDKGIPYYTSDIISELWPFGFHLISDVTYDTCNYVARYVTKKCGDVNRSDFESFGIMPPFNAMSRKPGIAKKWFDEHNEEAYNTYIINLSTMEGGVQFKPPHYFDRLYEESHPERMEEIKELSRIKNLNATRLKLSKTDIDFLGNLALEEQKFKANYINRKKLYRGRIENGS